MGNALAGIELDDGQKYHFVYDDASIYTLLIRLGMLVADPELNFEWRDALVVLGSIHNLLKGKVGAV